MKGRAFNPQVFLEFICYCFFGGLMLHLVNSEKYLLYVTPRMKPYLYFSSVVMLTWAFVVIFRIFRPQHRVRSAHCFVLVIPALFFLLPHNPLSVTDFSDNYISQNTLDTTTLGTQTNGQDENFSTDLPGLDEENKKIVVTNEDFSTWLSELYINMEEYEGYTVVMTGFVFKDPQLMKENEFVLARLMMSCCVADLSPAGLLCEYEESYQLEKGSWVTVEGTFFIGEYESEGQKYDEPQIKITKVTPAEAVEGYIYP